MTASGPGWFGDRILALVPNITLTDVQIALLFSHYQLLMQWNSRMNLTSVDTPDEIVSRHYCESLFFAAHLPDRREPLSIVDFGSGAGFPGYPMAILRPDWRVTLLEANHRRGVFLKEASRVVPNVTVATGRGEAYRSEHQWVVARAVKAADVLQCVPRLGRKVGLLAGSSVNDEVRRVPGLQWDPPLLIAGSEARYCLYGSCST